MARSVPPGQCAIWSTDDRLALVCLLGEDAPKVTSGGGWEAIDRPRRRPVTSWKGSPGVRIVLSLLLEHDYVPTAQTATKVRTLEKMAGFDAGDPEPPTLRFTANLYGHDFESSPDAEWVIESAPEWGDAEYDDDASMIYQTVTITLLQHIDTTISRLRNTAPFKRVTMQKGENLREFAKRTLGDARRWKDVQQLNKDDPRCPTSPSYELKADHRLRVPPREAVRK